MWFLDIMCGFCRGCIYWIMCVSDITTQCDTPGESENRNGGFICNIGGGVLLEKLGGGGAVVAVGA
jgi:hypothetical protein